MWKRAWEDTRNFFGWNKKSLLLPVLWIMGAVVFYFWQGLEAVVGEILRAIAFGLIPVGVFTILLLLWNLIRAPVYISFEKRIEPQLIIEDIKKENYGNVGGFSWGLVVKNKGIDRAEGCIGELIALDFADITDMSLKSWPVNQPLQWENITEYSNDRTSIDGGQKAILQIINRDFVRGTVRINAQHIAYSKSYEFRETHYLPVSNYIDGNNYLLVIGISSKDKLPVYAICYLKNRRFSNTCQMKLIEVIDEEPSIEECRQKLVARSEEIEKQLTSEWCHETDMDSHGY